VQALARRRRSALSSAAYVDNVRTFRRTSIAALR